MIALVIFEMRNTIIVSRGRGGVRGGLEEGAKYSEGKEDKKKKIPMKLVCVDVIGSVNYQNLLKLRYIQTINISSHLYIYIYIFFFSIVNTYTPVGFDWWPHHLHLPKLVRGSIIWAKTPSPFQVINLYKYSKEEVEP